MVKRKKGFYGIPDTWLNSCIETAKKGGIDIDPSYSCKKLWNQHMTEREKLKIIIENKKYGEK